MQSFANNSLFGARANAGTDSGQPLFVPPMVSPTVRGKKWHKRR
jgi:hypothetical protein